MYTSYEPSLAESEYASNWNSTDQYQDNPTAVAAYSPAAYSPAAYGGGVHSVDVHNSQSNDTYQQADAGSSGYPSPYQHADPGSGGYESPYTYQPHFGGDATNYNETHQYQNDPTVVLGDHIGKVDVHNDQSNATFQQADAGSGGHSEANNFNFTTQVQANPVVVVGDHIGSLDVHNSQSNMTEQLALVHH